MSLAAGMRLGPYEILSPLGAGGMGEVYRARDARLDRDVAVKVLPSHLAEDPVALARFEREAKTVAATSHPNILAIFEFGRAGLVAFAVTELLDGETLRARLGAGPIPVRKAIEYAVQVAEGLGAAHDKGIVHRDLKPENLFVMKDGRVKILDFGLARQGIVSGADDTSSPTLSRHTEPGTVLGTVGYMSPEQVRGKAADHRSDLFSFGAVLYEMLAGQRAFQGETPADTLTAILTKEPAEISTPNATLSPTLDRIVRRCLEKDPEARFRSAHDLGFALEVLSEPSRVAVPALAAVPARRRWLLPVAGGLVLLAGGMLGLGVGKSLGRQPLPTFKQLTFRRGSPLSAFFTADGQTVVYSATWDGQPPEIFSMRVESPESRPLGLPPARLLSVSSLGELAILLTPPGDASAFSKGTLARVPLSGGAPRAVLEDVYTADWSPDGHDLAVVRDVDGENQLEYPIGTVLKRPVEGFLHVRVAPQGDRVVFSGGADASVIDRAGHETPLKLPSDVWGVAWSPQGEAIWVDASEDRKRPWHGLWRVTLDGKAREVFRMAGNVSLHDVSKDGHFLIHHGLERTGARAKPPGEPNERELGVFGWSVVHDLTPDGTQLLFGERGPSTSGGTFMRSTRGGPPVRLGEGYPLALSPDGRWALVAPGGRSSLSKHPRLVLTPTGPGEPRDVRVERFERVEGGWFAGPGQIVLDAGELGRPGRTFVVDLPGGEPRAVTPEDVFAAVHSDRDGSVIGSAADGTLARYPLAGGNSQPIAARLPRGVTPISLSRDGRALLIYEFGPVPVRVERLDLTSGRRTLWKVLRPDDAAGVTLMEELLITPDEQAYAYTYGRFLQDLYLVEGLK